MSQSNLIKSNQCKYFEFLQQYNETPGGNKLHIFIKHYSAARTIVVLIAAMNFMILMQADED